MIDIPAGSFSMGSSGAHADALEQPVHAVTFVKAFRIGREEITAEEYSAVSTRVCARVAAVRGAIP
jgi:formylglycine-generating enzyme required for sulfatase activity